ncbi:hypothetical conserved protein [Oceanobacillus iheyensis HTE831]|uniref:Hypothetical conserved protein n=1 Tax=Oceanobacillus iheyensis (strain DSM 14371 / CIP 107618 / JCM 11309 / KCTC 3954 / HTE831) TaxID=221109 RepID=Q8ENW2_OCEIH|nr:hypothetical protein [Oceanobacillus iheyensis]BAC14320.1 hypothetical conserved protein [Oceanobacillus iheyensis HTE831]
MKKQKYDEISNVEKQKERLIPEEFPEGAYGSDINQNEPVQGKSEPWQEGQYRDSAFVYPDREHHEKTERRVPGSHPLEEESEE